MYVNGEHFDQWMEKLSRKLNEIAQNLKGLVNTNDIFPEDEKLLDNQDLAFMLKCSYRTLQRYRSDKRLPYFHIGHKIYYKTADVRAFVRKHCDYWTNQSFDKATEAKEES